MRAVRFEHGGKIDVVNVPSPEPGPEEVLVQVLAAGVCRTDLHLLDEMNAPDSEPLIPGHEVGGRIAKVGVDVYSAAVGDHVVVHFEQPCGECRQCRRMRTNLCERGHSIGFDAPGGYVDFVGTKATFDLGRSLLGFGGRFVAVAPGEERTTVSANDLVDGGKSYLGVYSSTMADLARVVALAEAGRLTPVVTRRAPLAAAAEILHDLRAGRIVGRAVLFPVPMDAS